MNEILRRNVLASLAGLLDANAAAIVAANAVDIAAAFADDPVLVDRMKVDEAKVGSMAASVRRVLASPDLVDRVITSHTRTDGLRIENRRVPFGTILIIFEARPDVCIEAAIIALKAGNRILLKGGKEARNTNLFLAGLWRAALVENGADAEMVRYLDISRDETRALVRGEAEKFDLVIPRGGQTLIDFVLHNSTAPVIVSGRGNNFLYIDSEADCEMAIAIVLDGKQRLSVCNALDKVLIHRGVPDLATVTTRLNDSLRSRRIEVFGDDDVCKIDALAEPLADDSVWYEEFLAAKIVVGLVDDTNDAIAKINQYSGGHSAAIITATAATAERFLAEVDCAAVYHNASVRFTDGGEFGLGAEIAISTQKLHFRGPLGAEHLLTNKWFVFGTGQIRN